MAIYFTGDTHGDFSRFHPRVFQEQTALTKNDYVIICGDFGGLWAAGKRQEQILDWLEERPFTTLFITGNHENYDLLEAYPREGWHGGMVQPIRPSVLHLMRGQVFELEGKKIFTMGGAACHDIPDGVLDPEDRFFKIKKRRLDLTGGYYRVKHQSWWEQELPSGEEYETARRNLDRAGWSVDYVITHCAPTSIQKEVGNYTHPVNELTDFLEMVAVKCRFRYWFFGHYHDNAVLHDRYILLYHNIIQLKKP